MSATLSPAFLAAHIERETERRLEERIKLLRSEDFYQLADKADGNALEELFEKVVTELKETIREQVEFEACGHYGRVAG